MNCKDVRKKLQRRFDAELPLDTGLGPHLTTCAPCRAYAERLRRLDSSLLDLPLHQPSPGFEARVAEALGRERRKRLSPAAIGLGVAAALVACAALGWLYPLEHGYLDRAGQTLGRVVSVAELRDEVSSIEPAVLLDLDFAAMPGAALDLLSGLWLGVQDTLNTWVALPQGLLWAAAAGLLALLVAFNTWQAHHALVEPSEYTGRRKAGGENL